METPPELGRWAGDGDGHHPDGQHSDGGVVREAVTEGLGSRAQLFSDPESYVAGLAEACDVAVPLIDRLVERRVKATLTVLAHEAQTSVAVAVLALETLAAAPVELSQEVRTEILDRAHRQVRDLAELLTALLESGDGDDPRAARRPSVDLRPVLTEFVDDMGGVIDGRVVSYSPSARPCMVAVDVLSLRRILGELVTNAVKYSQVGTPIEIVLGIEDGDAVVAVVDRGTPMTVDGYEALFERGHRADTLQRGHGLGLYLARRLARAQGGELRGRPRSDGSGTSFSVRLPLGAAA
jgi:signal transduction histidine kinase